MGNQLRGCVVICAGLLGLLIAVGPAFGQSDRELREENSRLRAQVVELTAELEAARERIAELEGRLEEAERAAPEDVPRRDPEPYTPPEPAWVDETEPDASPRALLAALQNAFEDAMAEREAAAAIERGHEAYVRSLGRWAQRMNREYRKPIDWYVVLVEGAVDGHWRRVRLQAVDPHNRVELGRPFVVELSNQQFRALTREDERRTVDLMRLRGAVHPQLQPNLDRIERGVFDNPPYIGRYMEFDYTVDVRSLVPAQPPEVDPEDDPEDTPDDPDADSSDASDDGSGS